MSAPARVEAVCSLCGQTFTLSRRHFRDQLAGGADLLCRVCRDLARLLERLPPLADEDALRFWLELPEPELDELLVELFGWRQGTVAARERRAVRRAALAPAVAA